MGTKSGSAPLRPRITLETERSAARQVSFVAARSLVANARSVASGFSSSSAIKCATSACSPSPGACHVGADARSAASSARRKTLPVWSATAEVSRYSSAGYTPTSALMTLTHIRAVAVEMAVLGEENPSLMHSSRRPPSGTRSAPLKDTARPIASISAALLTACELDGAAEAPCAASSAASASSCMAVVSMGSTSAGTALAASRYTAAPTRLPTSSVMPLISLPCNQRARRPSARSLQPSGTRLKNSSNIGRNILRSAMRKLPGSSSAPDSDSPSRPGGPRPSSTCDSSARTRVSSSSLHDSHGSGRAVAALRSGSAAALAGGVAERPAQIS
mmetsp:Transcript_14151/g.44251  ORF Transcript_14151/g.44251 Transcript_14151/m.44251 type:complete len:332 (-) Transcript_14151:372-1367(-)